MRGREDGPPPVTLPWPFDTASEDRELLGSLLIVNGMMIVGIVIEATGHSWFGTGVACVLEGIVAFLVVVKLRISRGARGTVFPDRVVLERNVFLGRVLPGPVGSYPIARFRSVEVHFKRRTGSIASESRSQSDSVWLLGLNEEDPNICLAYTDVGEGIALGEELAAALRLPVSETDAPMRLSRKPNPE